jgi:hypothetical protein
VVLGQAIATVSLAKTKRFIEQLDPINPVSRGRPLAVIAEFDPLKNQSSQAA